MLTTLAAAALALASVGRADDGALFDSHGCRACHRVGPRGGDAGPDLTLVGFRQTRTWIEAWLKSPRAWRTDTLMPEQGLADADRAALAEFLSGQKGQAWDRRPWEGLSGAALGRAIYIRAGCVACHGPDGAGGHPNPGAQGDRIPSLAALVGTYTAAELKAKVARGVPPMGRDGLTPAVAMPAWGAVLSGRELDALTAYLRTLARPTAGTEW